MKGILIILSLLCSIVYAQELSVGFVDSNYVLSETYGSEGHTQHKIELVIKKKAALTKDYLFEIKTTGITTTDGEYTILTPLVKIKKTDLDGKDSIIVPIYVNVSKDQDEETDEVFQIEVVNSEDNLLNDNKIKPITIKNGKKEEKFLEESLFNPFRVTVGANFDFQEKDASSFYFDITAYKPNLIRFKQSNWYGGFYSSVFHNKYSSIDSLIDSRNYYSLVGLMPGDSAILTQEKNKVTSNTAINNVAIEGGITIGWFKIMEPGETVSITGLIEGSARRRKFTTSNMYEQITLDTLMVPYNDSLNLLSKSAFVNGVVQETSIGAGFILQYRNQSVGEFMAKVTTGRSWLNSYLVPGPFFSARIQYIDPKVGINIGTEIRSFAGQTRERYIGVYFSKSFTLKKLTQY